MMSILAVTARHQIVTRAILEAAKREMRAVAEGLRDTDLRCREVEAIERRANELIDAYTSAADSVLMLMQPAEAMAHA